MTDAPHHAAAFETDAERFRRAIQLVRPRPQCLFIAIPAIAAAFALPAVLLCGVLGRQGIVWSIVLALASCACLLYRAGLRHEDRDAESQRAGDYMMAAFLSTSAAIFLAALALESGPWHERTLSITTAAPIMLGLIVLGVAMLLSRAKRICNRQR